MMMIRLSIVLGIGVLLALIAIFIFMKNEKYRATYITLGLFFISIVLFATSFPKCELVFVNRSVINDKVYLMREYYCKVPLTGYEELHQDILLLNLDNITQKIEKER